MKTIIIAAVFLLLCVSMVNALPSLTLITGTVPGNSSTVTIRCYHMPGEVPNIQTTTSRSNGEYYTIYPANKCSVNDLVSVNNNNRFAFGKVLWNNACPVYYSIINVR